EKYVIETSRGHRDAKHKEPIVLEDPQTATDLCFLPQSHAFDVILTDLDESIDHVELLDSENRQIAVLEVKNDTAFYTLESGKREAAPWRLHFPKAKAKVEIEGVTEWNDEGSTWFFEFANGALWTPVLGSWFPVQSNRWLIMPYNRVIYGQPGETKTTTFTIHNNGMETKKVALSLEFPDKKLKAELSDDAIVLAPNEEKEVHLTWAADQTDRTVHIRATSTDYSTYSTLYAKAGDSPVTSPIDIPLVLKP